MQVHRHLVIFLGVLLQVVLLHSKAVEPPRQEFTPVQGPLQVGAQKRVGYDYTPQVETHHVFDDHHDDHHHDHHEHHEHHEHPDPGYWKKKVTWKKGWKKIWKPGKKQIWKPSWKKYYKPIWVSIQVPAWKEIKVPDWKKIWKPVWKEIQVPAWKEIKVPDWKKIWKPVWKPIKVPAWKEIQVPDWKRIWKPVWKEIQVPAWKEIQVPAWKKLWKPEWIKVGIPGEHYLGKDHHGSEYTAHDVWKKKLIWKPVWKKYWKPAKKQIWVSDKKLEWKEAWKQIWRTEKKQIWIDDKKLVWKEAWKQIWRTEKKQIWVSDKKLEWKEAWKQIWRTEKKQIWVPDKKLEWKEAWKQIWVPAWKEIWLPAWKEIWKPVIIQEWFPSPDHHDHHHGWDRKGQASNQSPLVTVPSNEISKRSSQDIKQPVVQSKSLRGQRYQSPASLAAASQTANTSTPKRQLKSTWQFPISYLNIISNCATALVYSSMSFTFAYFLGASKTCFIAIFIISTNCASKVITTAVHSIPNKRSTTLEILPVKDIPRPGGFWKTRQEWRPYWVKDWVVKKIYVPVWKRVWGPAQVREWIPTGVAKPHPGIKHTTIIH